ncbi:MAG: protein kinase [Clostridia bacterium]|nr:protein kinase [Clostridia bacterium]
MELIEDSFAVCPKCGYDEETTDERLDQLKPGTLLKERFTIGRPLGRGGFGITYIAWDNSLQRKVAIKEYLPRGLASREPGNTTVSYDFETKEAFLRGVEKTVEESRKLAGFSELESVVNVHDCFKENGTVYIVMELLKGETVKEKLSREGNIPFIETIRIISPVLKTLAAVHKTGIIHRDISPDNIFICENGKVKLLDFGSARVADDANERSRSIVLKHGYAPKEQYTAKGKQGPYTDIYSVCATIYKMLTGITPVESLERMDDEDELQDISELVKIPLPAAKAIMNGLSVSASGRIQSAEELLEKLNEQKKYSSYDNEDTTVTFYVPKSASVSKPPVFPDEPVKASEIIRNEMHEDSEQINEGISNSNEEQVNSETDDAVIPEKSLPIADEVKDVEVEIKEADSENKVLSDPKVNPKEKKSSKRKNKKDKSTREFKIPVKEKKKNEKLKKAAVKKEKREARRLAKKEKKIQKAQKKLLPGNKSKLSKRTVRKIITAIVAIIASISAAVVWYICHKKNNPVLDEIAPDYETIEFGVYEQDNESSNGKERIKWRVLKKEEDRMFVISEYALDCKPFNSETQIVTWDSCSLRKWLNETFLTEAFSESERSMIQDTSVSNNDRTEKVFLLSASEVEEYFNDSTASECIPSDYALEKGALIEDYEEGEKKCYWWLRSSGNNVYYASTVNGSIGIDNNGYYVDSRNICVRPAMWINLSKSKHGEATLTDSSEKNIKEESVTFGKYEQDDNKSNGKEDIKWRVLAKEGNRFLVISEYALDCKPYNTENKNVTWETCTLRKWLNESFLNEAFSKAEQKKIADTSITSNVSDTTDKIFLLRISEAENYFDNNDRTCVPTKYAINNGASIDNSKKDSKKTCNWWLRSRDNYDFAYEVNSSGELDNCNDFTTSDICVRPAMWINIGDDISGEETSASTAPETTEPKPTIMYITTKNVTSKVHLREKPDKSSKSLGMLSRYTPVEILGKEGKWNKVSFDGKTGYVSAEYTSEKKPSGFTAGYVKDGVYYNDWAHLQYSIPDGWKANGKDAIGNIYKSSDFVDGWKFSKEKDYVLISFYKGKVNDIISKQAIGTNRETKMLAGNEWITIKNPPKSGLNVSASYMIQYYRQIGDYVVLVEIGVHNNDTRDSMSKGFSKYGK